MPRVVNFDFTGSPPEMGGGGSDRVPPGKYGVVLKEITDGTAKSSGKRMVTATYEVAKPDEWRGKKLVERFVLEPQSFGMKRFHAYLTVIEAPGVREGSFQLDLDAIVGAACYVDVYDEHQEANGQYQERTNSKIGSFYSVKSSNGAAPAQQPQQASAPPPQPAAPAPEQPQAVPAGFDAPAASAPQAVDVAAAAASVDELFK